ncbi:sugar ABC transporter ATP-binding protein [Microbacterium invictum]|jgi:ribose transport system ATP-binding protein|uniref:Sugar ABC transporter ATP-binding protein n=1 Tax=Microbacterium invictum TaxID=515415 RepID=A0ABZ0VF08_9MICO|nr:sugar ABC transporter ATP-binding protein [Microbacterium invictum]WQB71105.1 sugar ABC transporter ATP-binding protein [Microbacterium invictum]
MTTQDAAPALSVANVSKTFGTTRVLTDVTLSVAPGEVAALIGENGSGKSTFIKILSGFHEGDRGGTVCMGGVDVSDALQDGPEKTGMGFIHQDLALVETMTIVENLRIGGFSTGFLGRIRWRQEAETVRGLLRRVGLDVDPNVRVGELSVTDRALVAIARGLAEIDRASHLSARLLVLDEPTAYLPVTGVERLFQAVAQLAAEGVSVLFVSHRLDEVLRYCTRAFVLRGGRLVADEPTAGRTERDLVTLMLGRAPEDLYPEYALSPAECSIEVTGLAGGLVESVDFDARAGEIIGLIGLPGSGYEEIPYLLSGCRPATSGSLRVGDQVMDVGRLEPGAAIRAGVALLPADRKSASGAQDLSVSDNITVATLGSVVRRGVISRREERDVVAAQIERFHIALPDPQHALSSLSGGNQQKALLAKWVISAPRVFFLHEPTQGVDVGAKREVFRHLTELARQGATLVISSVEYEDLAALCTRVHVMRRGRIIRTIERDDLSAHELAVAVHG